MTQLEAAKKNIITALVEEIAKSESIPAEVLSCLIKKSKAVIPLNKNHRVARPFAVGMGLRTKVNANIGTSTDHPDIEEELKKLDAACSAGADAVMDLSVGADIALIRKKIIDSSPVPVGTVPIYEIAVNSASRKNKPLGFDIEDILEVLQLQAKQGVDFFTIHAGVTIKSVEALNRSKRIMGVVSRGGAILAAWIKTHKKENPFYEHFDKILDIAYEHDVCLSLGDALRPGSIFDATDKAQIAELKILGELAARANKKNVQVMIEGPGHVPLNQVKKNILLEKKICKGAPFYVLGPLVTDVAAGYDHISASIGGALAASYGADFLCYVTPSEHLRHPDINDVKEGVIASRIAAHAADLVKGVKSAWEWDKKMSLARRARDWNKQIELSIDPVKAKEYRMSSRPADEKVCTMCGKYCSIKLTEECIEA
ncbi:MAG: phosphomethylpyrimidine synthase ThiC [Candidatus Omnitrophica bacterium]|jgi:phosphomethylpyrimidine synthase|nr:phosphomethylpyrimidine synthase ThiC [Candidatus Omnitrophota bacterium]